MRSNILKITLIITLIIFCFTISTDVVSADVGNSFSGGVSSNSSSGSGDGLSLIFYYLLFYLPFPLNILFIVFLGYLATMGTGQYQTTKVDKLQAKVVEDEDDIVNKIKVDDKNFSKYAFLTYARECLITLQEAMEDKNLDSAKPFLEQNYLNLMQRNIDTDYTAYYEGQEILNATFKDYHTMTGYDVVVVELFVSEYQFILEKNQEVNKLNQGHRVNNVYELHFKRKSGILTDDNKVLHASNCPSCGAPNSINNQGSCEYCNNLISNGDYSFVLFKMQAVDERSSIYYRLYHSNKLHALNNEQQVVAQIKQTDEMFDLVKFEQYVEESLINVQEAWEARDLDEIRKYESIDLNDIHKLQIQEFIDKNLYPKIENQQIKEVHVNRFEIDGKYEYISVIVIAKLNDFVLDENGIIVSGNDKLDLKRGYALRYKRARGIKSKDSINSKFCPNCGSEIILGEFGNCDYCDSSIINGQHGWVMDSYEAINKV